MKKLAVAGILTVLAFQAMAQYGPVRCERVWDSRAPGGGQWVVVCR
jgi:hypothetical protein